MIIRIATWNIHRCIGRDGSFSPDNIANVLQQLNCDIISLQEVETCRKEILLKQFSNATCLKPVVGTTMLKENSSYGNIVLTRYPIQAIKKVDLSVKSFEPRGAIMLTLNVTNKYSIEVISTHLGLNRFEREKQVKNLLTHLSPNMDNKIKILMGDFNEWLPKSKLLQKIHATYGVTKALRTFPTRKPLFALDRIWVLPQESLSNIEVVKNSLTKVASDHYPLRATLEFFSIDQDL